MAKLTYLKKLSKMHKGLDQIISANKPLSNYASCFSWSVYILSALGCGF